MARRRRRTTEIQSYSVHFIPAEEGGYVVEVPALEGCFSQGETFEEAEANAREAIEAHLESLRAHGDRIPTDRGSFVKPVTVRSAVRSGRKIPAS
jgi:predicted RNase H-like HicB family nuclease